MGITSIAEQAAAAIRTLSIGLGAESSPPPFIEVSKNASLPCIEVPMNRRAESSFRVAFIKRIENRKVWERPEIGINANCLVSTSNIWLFKRSKIGPKACLRGKKLVVKFSRNAAYPSILASGMIVAINLKKPQSFDTMSITDPAIKGLIRAARSIFEDYALSPADIDEAVERYLRFFSGDSLGNLRLTPESSLAMVQSNSFFEPKAVESVLYSMNREDVWRRNSRDIS